MVNEPHGQAQYLPTTENPWVQSVEGGFSEREAFFTQLANALTILNGWVHLAQLSSCHTRQQLYLDVIQYTVQYISRLMQHYRRYH